MSSLYSDRQRQFEEYLRDGISAAKSGQCKLALSLLIFVFLIFLLFQMFFSGKP